MLTGLRHPPTANDSEPLGTGRTIVGWLTLSFLIIGFTPTPIAEVERQWRSSPASRQNRSLPIMVQTMPEGVRLSGIGPDNAITASGVQKPARQKIRP